MLLAGASVVERDKTASVAVKTEADELVLSVNGCSLKNPRSILRSVPMRVRRIVHFHQLGNFQARYVTVHTEHVQADNFTQAVVAAPDGGRIVGDRKIKKHAGHRMTRGIIAPHTRRI